VSEAPSHLSRRTQPHILVSARANWGNPGMKSCVSDDKSK
jgi:hypothetical protein